MRAEYDRDFDPREELRDFVVELDRLQRRAHEEGDELERDGEVRRDVLAALVLPDPRVLRVLLPRFR